MSKVYPATSLIGGGTGALDAIDGTSLADKDVAIVTVQDGNLYPYVLDEDSAEAENSPYIISPDANAGDKRWKLVGVQGAFSHVRATSASTSIVDSSATTVVNGVETYDTLGEYNNSTGIFTATYAGFYSVSVGYRFTSKAWTAGEDHILQILVDSSVYAVAGSVIEANITMTATNNCFLGLFLSAAQTVLLALYQNSGAALTLDGNAFNNWLTIDRIA